MPGWKSELAFERVTETTARYNSKSMSVVLVSELVNDHQWNCNVHKYISLITTENLHADEHLIHGPLCLDVVKCLATLQLSFILITAMITPFQWGGASSILHTGLPLRLTLACWLLLVSSSKHTILPGFIRKKPALFSFFFRRESVGFGKARGTWYGVRKEGASLMWVSGPWWIYSLHDSLYDLRTDIIRGRVGKCCSCTIKHSNADELWTDNGREEFR